jgi:nicotinamide-nucleotide amidase
MSAVVAARLKGALSREPVLTLAVAESLTCGRLQSLIGSQSGASVYFLGGLTAYSAKQKERVLGIEAGLDPVSERAAEQMALGACRLFGARIGASTTGYAEPSDGAAVPFAFWALADVGPSGRFTRIGRLEMPGLTRTQSQQLAAEAVASALVDWIDLCRKR